MLHMVCNLFIKNKQNFLKHKLCNDTMFGIGENVCGLLKENSFISGVDMKNGERNGLVVSVGL